MTTVLESAVGFLLLKIEEFVRNVLELPEKIKNAIDTLKNELGFMKAFLKEADARGRDCNIEQECIRQIQNLVYLIEDVFDMLSFKAQRNAGPFTKWRERSSMASSLEGIQAALGILKENMEKYRNSSHTHQASTSNDTNGTGSNTEIVGFEESWNALFSWVRDDTQAYKVMFVIGMGGSGKTTLVNWVCEPLKDEFDRYIWHDSEPQENVELLSTLWRKICNQTAELTQISSPTLDRQDLKDKLKEDLQNKRYLIVIDDLRTKDVWESVNNALPQSRGSRVIITTRRGDIASSYRENYVHNHHLQPLPQEKALQLFCKMAFPRDGYPSAPELFEELCKKCEGLPLALIEMGKVISNREDKAIELKRLHESLGAELRNPIMNPGKLARITKVLIRSYNDLPYHLKCCFLYLCMFPENYSVSRRMLTRLWIAEGFIEAMTGKEREDAAEDYLDELIKRNLIQTAEMDFDGRPITCRLHALMHKIALGKSEDDGFLIVCADPEKRKESHISWKNRRISVQKDFADKQFFVDARTIISYMRIPQNLVNKLNFLKILHLEGAPLDEFPSWVYKLLLLKYLCLSNTKITGINKSIGSLKFLETLNLKQTMVTSLPNTVTNLQNLRYLSVCEYKVEHHQAFDEVKGFRMFTSEISKWKNLQKLSFVRADGKKKLIEQLSNLRGLRKLGIIDLPRARGPILCQTIGALQNLQSLSVTSVFHRQVPEILDIQELDHHPEFLQRLYLKGRLEKMPQWISELRDLVRIRLKWSKLPSDNNPTTVLKDLPNLLELQLLDAYTGSQLVFDAGEFLKLKILEFAQMHELKFIITENGALPCIQKLIIRYCESLNEIAVGIDNLSQLKELYLIGLPPNLVQPLRRNGEKRHLVQHIKKISYEYVPATGGRITEDLS